MKITSIKLQRRPDDDSANKCKAVCSITIDDMLAIHQIKVIATADKKFIAMPSILKGDMHCDMVHPINVEARHAMENLILSLYDESVKSGYKKVTVNLVSADEDTVVTQTLDYLIARVEEF